MGAAGDDGGSKIKKVVIILCLAAIGGVLPLGGCYYMQAISGHTQLMKQRRPVAEVIEDPASPETLRERLRLVQEARLFSIRELALPDNDSYRSYADLGRDYVVWNVFAAPEFSLRPKQWCYLVAGCVAYRGYFDRADAVKAADNLRSDGFDVSLGGVSAYSTLGKFADPVLNTMMNWSNADLVATLFHELAHQELYVKGDTQFNESFASAVSDIGLERWFSSRGNLSALEEYRDTNALRHELLQLVDAAKADLVSLYASDLRTDEKRLRKRERLDALSTDAASLFSGAGLDRSPLAAPLNNARLISLGLYEGWVPAFRALYVECAERIDCFYDRAREVAALPAEERTARLELLSVDDAEPEQVAAGARRTGDSQSPAGRP